MNNTNIICTANALMVQQLACLYLSPHRAGHIRIVDGAHVTARRIANRTSVPASAITLSYLVEHPELGFAFRFRAVWIGEALLSPTATHVVIEQEWDDGDLGSPAAVSAAMNEWLQAVTP